MVRIVAVGTVQDAEGLLVERAVTDGPGDLAAGVEGVGEAIVQRRPVEQTGLKGDGRLVEVGLGVRTVVSKSPFTQDSNSLTCVTVSTPCCRADFGLLAMASP